MGSSRLLQTEMLQCYDLRIVVEDEILNKPSNPASTLVASSHVTRQTNETNHRRKIRLSTS
jgi:hypothetical protein